MTISYTELNMANITNLNEVFEICLSNGLDKILLREENMPKSFFDLSTRIAGEFIQKLKIYQIKTAIIIKDIENKSQYFKDMLTEENTKDDIGFFLNKKDAINWLLKSHNS